MPNNTRIYPVYSFYVYPSPLDVFVGEPMYMSEDETEAAFTQRVHAWFVEQYNQYHSCQ